MSQFMYSCKKKSVIAAYVQGLIFVE